MNRSLFASIAGHALIAILLWQNPSAFMGAPQKTPSSIQTRTLSEKEFNKILSKNQKAQIVQSEDSIKTEKFIPNLNEKTFLSKQNQYVDRNTRSARIGDHKNILKEGLPPIENLFKLQSSNTAMKLKSDDLNQETAKGKTHKFSRQPASVGDGISATDDYLPDIAISANTLLNTQEYIFASFYDRIREKLKHQWQSLLKTELEGLQRKGAPMFEGERTTKLKIFMNSQGEVKTIQKLGSAGYIELDQAAVDAFRIASPFPNPPQAMIEKENGVLQIEWHFVVLGSGQSGVRVNLQRHDSI